MIDSLASKRIKLIRPKESYPKDLARLEWRIKPMREETRIMASLDYSTFQNRDNSLSIKFKDYREELVHENEYEVHMLIIDIKLEDEPEISDYDPDAYYYYSTSFEKEYNLNFHYTYENSLDYLYMDSCLSNFEEEKYREKENMNLIIYSKEIRLSSIYIWEIETQCKEIRQIRKMTNYMMIVLEILGW